MLFETYWPGLALLGALGLIVGYRALQRRSGRMGLTALLLAASGAALVPLTMLVTTPRESMIEHTRTLVAVAVPPLDEPGLTALLVEQVELRVAGEAEPAAAGREALIAMADRARRKYRVADASIHRVEAAELEPGRGQSFLRLRTTLADAGAGIAAGMAIGFPTEWLIDWAADGDGHWRVTGLTLVTLAGRAAGAGDLP